MGTFKIGDLVNTTNPEISNAEIISIFTINNAAAILWKGRIFNVYLKNLALIRHRPFYVLQNRIKYIFSKLKNLIYRYNPLNYRITHKDNIDY